MEQIVSPGVFSRENDNSFITEGPIQAGAAIIGPAVKGPIDTPIYVTSYSQYESIFGATILSGSNSYSYLTGIAVRNYFNQGGSTLLVTRVVSGSSTAWTPASATAYSTLHATSASFAIETLSKGVIMNSTSSIVSGALASGSSDNLRWEISSVNTGSGTFTLLVRQGNDNDKSKTILETWNNLSLDPNANNYIAAVIGDQSKTVAVDGTAYYVATSGSYKNQSRYIRVASVTAATPNYFDNNGLPKSQYTSSFPAVGSGSFI